MEGNFAATLDYLETPDHAVFDIGAGQFTLDCQVKAAAQRAEYRTLMYKGRSSNYGVFFGINKADGTPYAVIGNGSGWMKTLTGGSAIDDDSWHHIEFGRDAAGNLYLFNGGVLVDSDVWVGTVGTTNKGIRILNDDFAGETQFLIGRVDEARYSTVIRHTSNFTPPSAPYGRV